MLASISLGGVIGLTGGIWLLLTIISVHSALLRNRTDFSRRAAPLLGLPTFIGGGTWAVAKLIPVAVVSENIGYYSIAATLVIIAINMLPCYKLVVWCVKHIDAVAQ